jgi:hypothetical protein
LNQGKKQERGTNFPPSPTANRPEGYSTIATLLTHLAKNLIFGRGRISKKGIEKVLPVVTDNTIHKERFREPTHCMH